MANAVITGKRVVLRYDEGSYGFNKLDTDATDESIYDLARLLNSFQDDRPPVKIECVTTTQII